jgi:hypothetical protein
VVFLFRRYLLANKDEARKTRRYLLANKDEASKARRYLLYIDE